MGNKLIKIKCPVCGKRTQWENNPYRPFCSKKCKLADLYGWLSEEYRIKINPDEIEDEYIEEVER
ncbi:DNA gyrase inhibitor YacG [Thermodesulfobacterium hydrogeniphilum]|uniref:DNA gyrase inhibitor YacG n=1 Tax=Thermodesulfobacterium hydrogeniphilum TaxID=161156 RepID=UPI0005708279|nr:DNA gyrase inhibitor YacG [Thermodesulfobacterium hydrogeniphilum]